ncbi:MAG: ATP phosphoribosyltransferase regulatory subunit [Lachnospiraceae bacterium]
MYNMELNLKKEDKYILDLRHLYEHHGFVHYKMNKFEEYDLYVSNKDFLSDGNVITFTDTNGKLLALKPDVTLSIAKNYKNSTDTVQKVYYDEHVYRTSKSTKSYKEITQMGLECMGDLDLFHISEVLLLAVKSLESVSSHYILDISHMGILQGFIEEAHLTGKDKKEFLAFLQEKNAHGMMSLLSSLPLSKKLCDMALTLTTAYGTVDQVLETLQDFRLNETVDQAIRELSIISRILKNQGYHNVYLDFSIVSNMNYYNGILFQGYIEGIPTSVLNGGQYSDLMKKMGKTADAIGFAIYLDLLEDYETSTKEYDVDILLLYDRSDSPEDVLNAVHSLTAQGYTVQSQRNVPANLRFRRLMKFEHGLLKEVEA